MRYSTEGSIGTNDLKESTFCALVNKNKLFCFHLNFVIKITRMTTETFIQLGQTLTKRMGLL